MMEYVQLLGAEDVQRAAASFGNRVRDFQQAINQLTETNERHLRLFEELVERLERLKETDNE